MPAGSLAVAAAAMAAAAGWLSTAPPAGVERLHPRVARAMRWHVPRFVGRGGGWLALVATAMLVASGVLPLVPCLAAALVGWSMLRRRRKTQRRARDRLQTADDVQALRALAAELRSGLPVDAALEAASEAGVAGGLAAAAASSGLRNRMLAAAAADRLGRDPAAVLASAGPHQPAARALAAAWSVSRQTGARMAGPVGRIAQAASADLELARESEAALAPARASARLLAVLPVAGVALGALSGTKAVAVLLHSGVGQSCLGLGVALDLAGLAWFDRLARARKG